MKLKNKILSVLCFIFMSFVLCGYRPQWEALIAKRCAEEMIVATHALERLEKGGTLVRGEGESINEYSLVEKGGLTTIPICPAGLENKPEPLPYKVKKNESGEIIVYCEIHGSRERIIVQPEDSKYIDLINAAKITQSNRSQLAFIIVGFLIWVGPVLTFLALAKIIGKKKIAPIYSFCRKAYLLPNYAMVVISIPGTFAAPTPPAQQLVTIVGVISLTAIIAGSVIFPAIESWLNEKPQSMSEE